MSIKTRVDLDAEDQAALRKLNDAQQGMQNFMQSMLTAGETRSAALQQQGREMFEKIALKHGLDLTTCQYVPNAENTALVLTAQRFPNAS
jgi:hypothetical protein